MFKKGFSLLEVLMSLFILVAAVTIFSSLQLKSLLRINKEKNYLDRIFIVRDELINFINQQDEKKKKQSKKNIDEPELKIISEIIDIDKKSELNNFSEYIQIVKTEGAWDYFGNNYSLPFITFVVKEKEVKQ